MKVFLTALSTVSFLALATSAFATDPVKSSTDYKEKANGGYEVESKTKLTTPNGTDKTGSHKVDVEVNDNGTVDRDVKTERSSDPEGLMNGTKDTHKVSTEHDEDGTAVKKEVKEHVDHDGTNTKVEVEQKNRVNANGTVDHIVETTKKFDPKGLMNSSETTTKTINGKVAH